MSTPCLVFVRLLIPQYRVNYCHFWMPIWAIIKSAMPFGIFCYTKMAFGLKNGGYISEGHSDNLRNSDHVKYRGIY
jgi:hypothetical protein